MRCRTGRRRKEVINMSVFGEKIRARREEMRLSQEQLAGLCGLSRRSIISYETTDKRPHASTIRALAKALKVTVRYLERDEITDPQAGIEQEPFISEAREMFGSRGAEEMTRLLEQNEALFAGGTLTESQKDMFYEAITRAYFANKQKAREKYGRKKPEGSDAQ